MYAASDFVQKSTGLSRADGCRGPLTGFPLSCPTKCRSSVSKGRIADLDKAFGPRPSRESRLFSTSEPAGSFVFRLANGDRIFPVSGRERLPRPSAWLKAKADIGIQTSAGLQDGTSRSELVHPYANIGLCRWSNHKIASIVCAKEMRKSIFRKANGPMDYFPSTHTGRRTRGQEFFKCNTRALLRNRSSNCWGVDHACLN
jgi:hypothetical protein